MEREKINREDLEKEREFVERRLSELDRRRDDRLTDKLLALEKLFQVIVATKSDAISIAVSRIQGDSKDCVTRCGMQVRIFYELINSMKDDVLTQKLIMDLFKTHVAELEKEHNEEIEELNKLIVALTARMELLEKWKLSFWAVNMPAVCALSMTVSITILAGWAWVIDYIKKMHGG